MKKLLSLFIVIVLVISVASCKKDKNKKEETEYTITFNEKEETVTTKKFKKGDKIDFISPTEFEGFEFIGWSNEYKGEPIDTSNIIASKDQDFYALYKEVVVVDETYDLEISLPSTELLVNATPHVVEGAPDLMIIGAVLDTYYYYHYETMSGFEYIKVYNNTLNDYNMKNHRIVLANPTQGNNIEIEEVREGAEVLQTGYLFSGLIDEDFIIPSLSIGLIWLRPYFFEAGCGSSALTKKFSATIIHADTPTQKGAFSQTIDDFKEFWNLQNSTVPILSLTNMPIIGSRTFSNGELFPVITPASGTQYTHLNGKLLRSLEIQKFDDQDGSAMISLLNKYEDLSDEKKQNPDYVYGKQAFNAMEIIDNGDVVDGYLPEMLAKYFDCVCRINFCGRIDTTTLEEGQQTVSFSSTDGGGVGSWENSVEVQFSAPIDGTTIMRMIVPVREKAKYETYLNPSEFNIMRIVEVGSTYRLTKKTIKLLVNPADGLELINWKADEIKSDGRLSCACPTEIKAVNLEISK